jgi:hypothetical protein
MVSSFLLLQQYLLVQEMLVFVVNGNDADVACEVELDQVLACMLCLPGGSRSSAASVPCLHAYTAEPCLDHVQEEHCLDHACDLMVFCYEFEGVIRCIVINYNIFFM